MYLENHQFSKIPPKNSIDFCPGRFYRLGTCGMLRLLSRRVHNLPSLNNISGQKSIKHSVKSMFSSLFLSVNSRQRWQLLRLWGPDLQHHALLQPGHWGVTSRLTLDSWYNSLIITIRLNFLYFQGRRNLFLWLSKSCKSGVEGKSSVLTILPISYVRA